MNLPSTAIIAVLNEVSLSTEITTITDILERTTYIYSTTIEDASGEAIPADSLSALTLTLYAERSGTIINDRNAQNILDANDVTVSSGGALAWTMQAEDNAIVNTRLTTEPHIALFEWTYGSSGYGKQEVRFVVRNLAKVA